MIYQFNGSARVILDEVIETMQQADELRGVDYSEYVQLMLAIKQVAELRMHNALVLKGMQNEIQPI